MATMPMPSAIPGWYVADEPGQRNGYTSDPAQARHIEVTDCSFCGESHPGTEGACLL